MATQGFGDPELNNQGIADPELNKFGLIDAELASTPSGGSGTTFNPTGGALALVGGVALLALGLLPASASAALTGGTPAVSIGSVRSPSGASLVLAGSTPTLIQGTVRAPAAASLTLSGTTPYDDQGYPTTAGSLALSGTTPTLLIGASFAPSGATLTLSGGTPTADLGILPSKGTLVLSGGTPGLLVGISPAPSGASLVLSGTTPTQDLGLRPAGGTLALSGATPALVLGTVRSPSSAALTLAGTTPTRVDQGLPTSAGALTLSGATPTLQVNGQVTFSPAGAALSLSGQIAYRQLGLPASSAALVLAGGSGGKLALTLSPAAGALVLTPGTPTRNLLPKGTLTASSLQSIRSVDSLDPLMYANLVLADHPSAYFRLEPTSGSVLVDSSGHGRDATMTTGQAGLNFRPGALTCGGFGVLGDGTEGAVSFSHPAVTDITIAAWVKFPTFNVGEKRWITIVIGTGADTGLIFDRQNRKLVFFISGHTPQVSNTALLTDRWYHMAAVVSGSTVTFYVNGVADGSFAGTGYSGMTPGYILSDFTSPDRSVGTVDEIEIFDYTLAPARLAARAALGLPFTIGSRAIAVNSLLPAREVTAL